MYSKLFARITESSLMEEPINVRYTFVLMLAIADPEGYVIGTDVAIARRLNMDLDLFRECAAVLMQPDPDSNSKVLDGVRLVNSEADRGYRIVNFTVYRDMKSPEDRREYMKNYMRERRKTERALTLQDDVNSVNNCKPQLAQLGHGDGDGDGDVLKKGARAPKEKKTSKFTPPTTEEVEAYCDERDNAVPVDQWFAHYESNGWKVGRNTMKDWKAAIRTWEPNHPKPISRVATPEDMAEYNPHSPTGFNPGYVPKS